MKSIKVDEDVFETLIKLASILSYRDGKRYTMNDIAIFLIEHCPTIEVPFTDDFKLVEESETVKEDESDKDVVEG